MNKIIFSICLCVVFDISAQTPTYQWSKRINSIYNNFEDISGMVQNSAGEVYVAGVFTGTTDLDPSSASANVDVSAGWNQTLYNSFIAKYNSSGNYVWGGSISSFLNVEINDLAIDHSGNIIVVGFYNGNTDFSLNNTPSNVTGTDVNGDIFLAKYTSSGNISWVKTFGGSSMDRGKKVQVDSDDNIIMSGTFASSSVDFDPSSSTSNLTNTSGNSSSYIAKYTSSGSYKWAKKFSDKMVVNDIATNSQNKVFVTGYFSGTVDFNPSTSTSNLSASGSSLDIFIAQYSSTGTYGWAKKIGDTGDDIANTIEVSGSDFWIGGDFKGTVDFDPSSSISSLTVSGSNKDAFFSKYTQTGSYIAHSAKAIRGTGEESITDMLVNSTGDLYLCGYFQEGSGGVDVDPSSTVVTLSPLNSAYQTFVAKYSSTGTYGWAFKIDNQCAYPSSNTFIAYRASGSVKEIIVASNLDGSADFDPSTSTSTLTGNTDMYFAKYKLSSNSMRLADENNNSIVSNINTLPSVLECNLYPNPVSTQLNVHIDGIENQKTTYLQIIDISGRVLNSSEFRIIKEENQDMILDVQQLQNGFYIVSIQTENGVIKKSFLKQ